MQVRRHKDILAVKAAGSPPVALHARGLEIAEISEDAWNALVPVSLGMGQATVSGDQSEALSEIEAWNDEEPETTSTSNSYGIRSLTINVTQICNLHCTYCAAGGDGSYGDPVKKIAVEKTLPQIRIFLEQVQPGESFHIAFLGGEPLLYPETIRAIGEYAREEGARRDVSVTFKVTTNGTLVTDAAIAALRAIRSNVVVSLDGPAEINDRQRVQKDGRGSFQKAHAGLLRLLEHKSELGTIGVHAVFNERNLEVEAAWEMFHRLPVDFMEFTYAVNAPDAEATRVYNEALGRIAARAFELGGEDELRRINNFGDLFRRFDHQERLTNHCGLGKSLMVIDARNKLYNCPWTVGTDEGRLGEGTEVDYDRIARHQASQIETNNCGRCWARFLCGGGCSFVHGSTGGSMKEKKLDFCERTRFLTALAMVYYHRSRAA